MARTKFDALVDDGRKNPMSPEEKRAQRVSMAMGLKAHDSKVSSGTVASVLDRSEGVRSKHKPRSA